MVSSGVPEIQAKIMYIGVYGFGPRWNAGVWCVVGPCAENEVDVKATAQRKFDQGMFDRFTKKGELAGISLEEAEQEVDRTLRAEMTDKKTFDAKTSPYKLVGTIEFARYFDGKSISLVQRSGALRDIGLHFALFADPRTIRHFCVKAKGDYEEKCELTKYGDQMLPTVPKWAR
jgi:hypothetical protein